MVTFPMNEGRLVVVMDDLDLELEMLHLKQRCSIGMAPLIELQIGAWKF
jgi:peptidyl-tRNA hydrolase